MCVGVYACVHFALSYVSTFLNMRRQMFASA